MLRFLATLLDLKSSSEEPRTEQEDNIEFRVGGMANSGPEPSPFLVIFSLLDPDCQSSRLEVEKQVTDIKFCNLGDSKGTDGSERDN